MDSMEHFAVALSQTAAEARRCDVRAWRRATVGLVVAVVDVVGDETLEALASEAATGVRLADAPLKPLHREVTRHVPGDDEDVFPPGLTSEQLALAGLRASCWDILAMATADEPLDPRGVERVMDGWAEELATVVLGEFELTDPADPLLSSLVEQLAVAVQGKLPDLGWWSERLRERVGRVQGLGR